MCINRQQRNRMKATKVKNKELPANWRSIETKKLEEYLRKNPNGKISDYLSSGGTGSALLRYQKNKNKNKPKLILDWEKDIYSLVLNKTATGIDYSKKVSNVAVHGSFHSRKTVDK